MNEPDWWDDLLPFTPHAKPPGALEMLRVIVYDIACPKRLRRIAEACEQSGVRVQKSVFECWLDEPRFNDLWDSLREIMDPKEDTLAAYVLDTKAARHRRAAGKRMTLTEKRHWYVL